MSLFKVHPAGMTPGIPYFSPQIICLIRQLRESFWLSFRNIALALVLLATSLVAGCKEPTVGVGISGIDHLPEHLSVQQFYVDGYSAFQAGDGGSVVCCAVLPRRWRPDLTVEIRDCDWMQHVRRVPVDRYQEPGRLWVHFLKDGAVRVVSSGVGPGNPDYPGPHDSIPSKEPWHKYPWDERCDARYKGDAPRIVEDEKGPRA